MLNISHFALLASFCCTVGCGGSSAPPPLSPSETSTRVAPALVTIEAGDKHGIGTIVDARGLIAANLALVEGAPAIAVHLHDDAAVQQAAIVVADQEHGVALLRIASAPAGAVAVLGDADAGEHIYHLKPDRVSEGMVSSIKRLSPHLEVLEIQTSNPEEWSGPLFNRRGQLIGLAAAYVRPPGVVIGVPSKYVRSLLTRPLP